MNNKLPKVFTNKIEKQINNNEKIYITKKDDIINPIKEEIIIENKNNIEKRLKEIINNNNYAYIIPVKIETTDEVIETRIIGKNKKNILTYDNKKIEIDTIKNIEILNQK